MSPAIVWPGPSKDPAFREIPMKYGLFWLLGVPIPVLIIAFLIFH
jgi:hypothetical protein